MHLTSKLNGSWQWAKETTFYNNGNVKINGNLGIGTSSPLAKLDILLGGWGYVSRVTFKQISDNPSIRLYRPTGSTSTGVHSWWIENTGNDGLNLKYGLGSTAGSESVLSKFTFSNSGSLGIGTTTTGSHKLAVEGSIGAREVKVQASGWSDFVFYKDYKLPTLKEVATHIKEKGHLQDIPSAKEVRENGIFLGEMDAKLLQKIEELTLYTLQQEKKLTRQEKEILVLKKQFKQLEKLINKN
ncbi:hypothetical protein N9Q58_02140, partial [Polaribacter sp.]|nr:hypothetical protein [Polaribacter sp.]